LFVVLQGIAMSQPKGVLTDELVESARNASIFGAPIYGTFIIEMKPSNPTATFWVTLFDYF
jgi:hypothetical protein